MSMFDVFVVVVSVFLFALAAAVLGIMVSGVDAAFSGLDPATPGYTEATTITGTLDTNWGPTVDWLVICLAFGLPLISAVLAWMNNIPNIFFFLSIGLLFVLVFIGWGLQWGAEGLFVTGNAVGSYISAYMPMSYWVLSNYGLYSVFAFLIIGFGTYVRFGRGGGGFSSGF